MGDVLHVNPPCDGPPVPGGRAYRACGNGGGAYWMEVGVVVEPPLGGPPRVVYQSEPNGPLCVDEGVTGDWFPTREQAADHLLARLRKRMADESAFAARQLAGD